MKKKNKIFEQIKKHHENKLYTRIKRGKKDDYENVIRGYILKYSENFILLKEEDDFKFCGFNIIPIKTIKNIRYNLNDQYYDFISKSEHDKSEFELKNDLDFDLTSWKTIFTFLKSKDFTVISECEKLKDQLFCIGSIIKVDENKVLFEYFNAQGFIDEEPVKHKYKWITKITFLDNYSKVFSKYKRKN